MSKSFKALGLAVGALALTHLPAAAQTKVTNEGISATELVIGTHQDLSGPIKVWGVPVSNGMKMAVEEINAAGGINGRKLKMILEDNGYDPKKAVLATQKMVERDKVFAMIGPMGSPTVLAAQDILFDAGILQLFPLTAAEFTFKFDPAKPQERLKFNNLLPYVESTRAAVKYMMEAKNFQKPCIMHQDDEYGKNVLDGFTQQLAAMKVTPASVTSYKRGASDFSAPIAKMKSDGCDLVVLGTIIRETIGTIAESHKTGFTPTFLGSSASYTDLIHKLGGKAMDGLYATMTVQNPYLDDASKEVSFWAKKYKTKFSEDPTVFSVYGYGAIDAFATAAAKAGPGLNTDSFIKAMDTMIFAPDMFGSAPAIFTSTKRLGSDVSRLSQLQDSRWKVVSEYFNPQ
jgi:ABC-type branched-subunit amino acid transport system substrate-binding protein